MIPHRKQDDEEDHVVQAEAVAELDVAGILVEQRGQGGEEDGDPQATRQWAALGWNHGVGQTGRRHQQRQAVRPNLDVGVFREKARQQHQRAGQVARKEVQVEKAPFLNPVLPRDVQYSWPNT